MSSAGVFLDTSFVIALFNAGDRYHLKAKQWDQRLSAQETPLFLHAGILLEIGDGFARLDRRERGIEIIEGIASDKSYVIVDVDELLLNEARALYSARPDTTWGLTDCASFRVMESLRIQEALTSDIHFVQAGFRALLLEE